MNNGIVSYGLGGNASSMVVGGYGVTSSPKPTSTNDYNNNGLVAYGLAGHPSGLVLNQSGIGFDRISTGGGSNFAIIPSTSTQQSNQQQPKRQQRLRQQPPEQILFITDGKRRVFKYRRKRLPAVFSIGAAVNTITTDIDISVGDVKRLPTTIRIKI